MMRVLGRVVVQVVAQVVLAAVFVGAAADGPRQISESARGAYEASFASLGTGFVVARYDTRDETPAIYFRQLDRQGQPSGPERRLVGGESAAFEPDVAAVGQNVAVAWYEKSPSGTYRPMLGLWTPDGRQIWTRTLTADGHTGRNPVVRAAGSRIFCAWIDYEGTGSPDVRAGWFDAKGRPLSLPQRLAQASRTTWNLNAAIDPQGRGWVVFDAQAGTKSDELFLVRVDASTSQVIRLTADDGKASKYPDLAFAGNRVALTWFDERDGNQEVYLFVAPVSDAKEGLEQRAVRVTETPGASIGAYLAWNGPTVGLAWCDNTEGQNEIYFASFDNSGHALRSTARLTRTPTESLIPAIHPSGKGFALAWNEFTPGPRDVHDADGKSQVFFSLQP